jgi:hypothetical protein
LPNVNIAIERAQNYETNIDNLIDKVGTNLGELIEKMRENR